MGSHKKYGGEYSFSYLTAGEDYKPFELAEEIGRVKSSVIKLSKNEEDRVNQLIEKCIIISLHDHPSIYPKNISEIFEYVRQNRIFLGYKGLAASGLDAVFDGLLDGTNLITSNTPWKWDSTVYEIGMRLCDIAHQDFVIRGEGVEDIRRAHREGKVALILHLEGASMIENELDRIDILYGFGVRCMGLVYSDSNAIGGGLKEKGDGGLTDFGYKVVKRMNKVGVAIDLAHVGDRTSLDAIDASDKPILITHAGSRTVWNTKRMKPDEVLQAMAEKGGIIGLEAAPHTTLSKEHPHHTIESIMDHFKYLEKLIGLNHIAFGPDTLFGDHVGLHKLFIKELSISQITGDVKHPTVEYVDGLENPSEFTNIIRWLVREGYSDQDIAKVVGENILRVLSQIWRN
ncbi:MAG: membrane dipeptidase [Thermoprotei archaeon]